MKARLYTPGHYIGVGLHYVAAGALLTGAVLLAQPWVVGMAAVLVGGTQFGLTRMQNNFFETKLKKHDAVHEHSPRLGEISRELYEKSGLKAKDFPIYDFVADEQKMAEDPGKGLRGLMNKAMAAAMQTAAMTPNAAAVRVGKPVIMISAPLLRLLNDAEEKAVLAHEFAHAAARHHHVRTPMNFMLGVAATTAAFMSIGAFFSAGFLGVVAGIGASVVASMTIGLGYLAVTGKLKGLTTRTKDDMTRQDLADKKKANLVAKLSGIAARVGVVTLFNPVYAGVYAVAKATGTAKELIVKRLSRHHEYQADRGAVALGADPLALITALRKITHIVEESAKEAYDGEGAPKKGYLTSQWKKATATHPELDLRVKRLAKMAAKQKAEPAAIEAAVKGEITVDRSHLLNASIIRTMAAR